MSIADGTLWEGLGRMVKDQWRQDQKFMKQEEIQRRLQDTWLADQKDRQMKVTVGICQRQKLRRYTEQLRVAMAHQLYPLTYPVLHGNGTSCWEQHVVPLGQDRKLHTVLDLGMSHGYAPDSHTLLLQFIQSFRAATLKALTDLALPGFVTPLHLLIAEYARPIRFCTTGQDLPEIGLEVVVMDKQAVIVLDPGYVLDHKGNSPGHVRVWNGKDESSILETTCWRLFTQSRYFRD